MGDLNTRFGFSVRAMLCSEYPVPATIAYQSIPDEVTSPNDNSYKFSTMCKDNDLLVINNLKHYTKHFVGGKTYKKKDVWMSELDVVVASDNLCITLKNFRCIRQLIFFPTTPP